MNMAKYRVSEFPAQRKTGRVKIISKDPSKHVVYSFYPPKEKKADKSRRISRTVQDYEWVMRMIADSHPLPKNAKKEDMYVLPDKVSESWEKLNKGMMAIIITYGMPRPVIREHVKKFEDNAKLFSDFHVSVLQSEELKQQSPNAVKIARNGLKRLATYPSTKVREAAIGGLVTIGKEGIEILEELAKHGELPVRFSAAKGLVRYSVSMGSKGIGYLVKTRNSPDWVLRLAVAEEIGKCYNRSEREFFRKRLLPILGRLSGDPHERVKEAARKSVNIIAKTKEWLLPA